MNIDDDPLVWAWLVAMFCKIMRDALIVIDAHDTYRRNLSVQKLNADAPLG